MAKKGFCCIGNSPHNTLARGFEIGGTALGDIGFDREHLGVWSVVVLQINLVQTG